LLCVKIANSCEQNIHYKKVASKMSTVANTSTNTLASMNGNIEESWDLPAGLDEDRLVRVEGEVVRVQMTPEKQIGNEPKMGVALLPLVKEPNRSVCRLYRAAPETLVDPVFIGTGDYQDLFILRKAETYESLDGSEIPQRFSYEVCGFGDDNELKFKDTRSFTFVYEELIPVLAKQRLSTEFMMQLRDEKCAQFPTESARSFAEHPDCLSTSPIEMLMQTMLTLRNVEHSECLKYVDIETLTWEVPKKHTKPIMPLEPSVTINMPCSKRAPNDHVYRCRVTGNHVE